MSTLVEKWDGKFVVRRSLESAWVEEMEAVPLIDGILVGGMVLCIGGWV